MSTDLSGHPVARDILGMMFAIDAPLTVAEYARSEDVDAGEAEDGLHALRRKGFVFQIKTHKGPDAFILTTTALEARAAFGSPDP
jgi:hypothetical protein